MDPTLTASKIRVLIADDHAILRDGLCTLLSEEADFEVVGAAGDGDEALRLAAERSPDVVVADIGMPGPNGVAVARRIRSVAPRAKVLILTMHREEEYVYESLRAGATGYLLKTATADDLLDAIRRAARGERSLSPEVAALVVGGADGVEGGMRRASGQLTNREREVLKLLAGGMTIPEIGCALGISRKTADVHKTRLMRKLDVHNRAQLVRYAVANGLTEL